MIEGRPGAGRRSFAAAVAAELGHETLAVNPTVIPRADWAEAFMLAQRFAIVGDLALVWTEGAEAWPAKIPMASLQFVCTPDGHAAPSREGAADIVVRLPEPGVASKTAAWRALAPHSPTRTFPGGDAGPAARRSRGGEPCRTALDRRGIGAPARPRPPPDAGCRSCRRSSVHVGRSDRARIPAAAAAANRLRGACPPATAGAARNGPAVRAGGRPVGDVHRTAGRGEIDGRPGDCQRSRCQPARRRSRGNDVEVHRRDGEEPVGRASAEPSRPGRH